MIDWTQVKTLQNDVGQDSFPEIVEIFIEEVEEVITRLRSSPDPATLGDDLHFLKGSALNLGFSEFSGMCQIGETASARGAADDVDLSALIHSYDQSKNVFLNELAAQISTAA